MSTARTRRLNVCYKDGKNKFAHTLNGTAVAVSPLVAILENCQNEGGSMSVPPAFVPYCGFDKIEPRHRLPEAINGNMKCERTAYCL